MTYPGGKGHCYQKIINLIPPHRVYIAAFAGFDAVLRNKRPAAVNIAIDVDAAALDLLRSNIVINGDMDHIARNGDDAGRWQFINTDALQWLKQYTFHGDEFVYLDPPYLMHTRRQHRQIYRYELATVEQHAQLLDIITGLPCKMMISGYWSELYAQRLAGWVTESFEVQTRGGGPATEYIWMNYPPPIELHDYQYLGENFRERERIKRKKTRWVNKLARMPRLERLAISAAIAELGQGGHRNRSNGHE